MDGAHDTGLDGSVIIKSLSHRSEAVGGAGSSGDNLVVLGEGLFIDIENDGLQVIACRSGDNNLLCACVDVSHGLFLGSIETGAFENDVNIELTPGAVCCILFSIDSDFLTVNDDGIFGSFNGVLVFADTTEVRTLSGIILEKMSEHCGAGEIVDSDDFIAFSAEHLAESETTDAAETINCNFYGHFIFLQ